jgi:hypothetical protein
MPPPQPSHSAEFFLNGNPSIEQGGQREDSERSWAGSFNQSMGTRNREGIGLSYPPAGLHRLTD